MFHPFLAFSEQTRVFFAVKIKSPYSNLCPFFCFFFPFTFLATWVTHFYFILTSVSTLPFYFYVSIFINAFAVLPSKVYFCICGDVLKPSCHLLPSGVRVYACVLFGWRGANVWKEGEWEESAVGSPDCCGSWKNEITWMLSQTFLDVTLSTVWSASYSWHLMT